MSEGRNLLPFQRQARYTKEASLQARGRAGKTAVHLARVVADTEIWR